MPFIFAGLRSREIIITFFYLIVQNWPDKNFAITKLKILQSFQPLKIDRVLILNETCKKTKQNTSQQLRRLLDSMAKRLAAILTKVRKRAWLPSYICFMVSKWNFLIPFPAD